MDLIVVQILVLFLLLFGTLLCGTLPILCFKTSKCFSNGNGGNKITAFLIYFGGGVLMTTCFLHLLPEARESFPSKKHEELTVTNLYQKPKGKENTTVSSSSEAPGAHSHEEFALPEFLVLCGLFATYLVEEIIHSFVVRFRGLDAAHQIGAKLCTCAQRDTECSRPYKDAKPNSSLYSAEKKDDQTNSVKTSHQQLDQTSQLHVKIAQGEFPNYGSVHAGPSAFEVCDETPNIPAVVAPNPIASEGHVLSYNISLASLLTVCALSFHSIFEGFALGFQRTIVGTWTLFLAVAVHKFVIAFVIGMEVMFECDRPSVVFAYMSAFSCMSPIGMTVAIFTGIELQQTSNYIVGVLSCVATGTLLYVTFFEIIPRKTSVQYFGCWKFCAITLGAGLMTLVQYITTIL